MRDDIQKKRLTHLIEQFSGNGVAYCDLFAEFLLQHGVIIPPVQVGQEVYIIYQGYIAAARVIALYVDKMGGMFDLDITTNRESVTGYQHEISKNYLFEDCGSSMFLNREEAEKELGRRAHHTPIGETTKERETQ